MRLTPLTAPANLPDAALTLFYKARRVQGDCRFALRPTTTLPDDLLAAYAALYARVSIEGRKETPADKADADALRTAVRRHLDGAPYTLPAIAGPAKAKTIKACPHCGLALGKAA